MRRSSVVSLRWRNDVTRPLRVNLTLSIKPEVRDISQWRQSGTKPRPWETCIEKLKIRRVVPEICSRTDEHTSTQTGDGKNTGNESVPKIRKKWQHKLIFKTAISILVISTVTASERCLIKSPPYILFEKYILVLEIASPREPALCQLYRHTFVPSG